MAECVAVIEFKFNDIKVTNEDFCGIPLCPCASPW
jgi:hypothetical protein